MSTHVLPAILCRPEIPIPRPKREIRSFTSVFNKLQGPLPSRQAMQARGAPRPSCSAPLLPRAGAAPAAPSQAGRTSWASR
eukprot:2522868-Pyramimonas_sp.AAC.1